MDEAWRSWKRLSAIIPVTNWSLETEHRPEAAERAFGELAGLRKCWFSSTRSAFLPFECETRRPCRNPHRGAGKAAAPPAGCAPFGFRARLPAMKHHEAIVIGAGVAGL